MELLDSILHVHQCQLYQTSLVPQRDQPNGRNHGKLELHVDQLSIKKFIIKWQLWKNVIMVMRVR